MKNRVMSALADSNRLQIVELLRERPLTVGEITERLQLRQPQVSKHLRVLSEAGIVQARANANCRIYSLLPEPFREMDGWLGTFRFIWKERYGQLDDYLHVLQDAAGKSGRSSGNETN